MKVDKLTKTKEDKIREKLSTFLNREPTENEIINAQTDINIMGSILQDDINQLKIK